MTLIQRTRQFKKLFKRLPTNIQEKAKRQIKRLALDSSHPSLRVRKMVNKQGVWEARVNGQYRMTFTRVGDMTVLRAIGTHQIYKHA